MRNRMVRPRAERIERASVRGAWWRQPVLWLGATILAASLAGCIVMLMLAARHADEPLPGAGPEVFRVPLARPQPPHAPLPPDAR